MNHGQHVECPWHGQPRFDVSPRTRLGSHRDIITGSFAALHPGFYDEFAFVKPHVLFSRRFRADCLSAVGTSSSWYTSCAR